MRGVATGVARIPFEVGAEPSVGCSALLVPFLDAASFLGFVPLLAGPDFFTAAFRPETRLGAAAGFLAVSCFLA